MLILFYELVYEKNVLNLWWLKYILYKNITYLHVDFCEAGHADLPALKDSINKQFHKHNLK